MRASTATALPSRALRALRHPVRTSRRLARRWATRRRHARYERLAPVRALVADGHAELTTARGRRVVAVRRARTTPWELAAETADLVSALLDDAGIVHFATNHRGTRVTTWAVLETDWPRALAALADLGTAGDPVYAAPARSSLGSPLATDAAVLATLPVLRVFRYVRDLATGRLLGADMGCELHRWSADEHGRWTAPARTGVVQCVDDLSLGRRARWDGASEPVLAVNEVPDAFEVTFPVDAVYLWVDDADDAWRARRDVVRARLGLAPAGAVGQGDDAHRFRDRGELRHSMRSIETYAPWIRQIYLVTDDQVPTWLDTSDGRVRVVDHREIFEDPSLLPTYNSHSIGAQVHRIPGLSEHYLLMNDDVLLNRAVEPADFFTPAGQLKVTFSRSARPDVTAADRTPVEHARERSAALLVRDHGRRPSRLFAHVPVPQRIDVAEELLERYPEEVRATLASPFRAPSDVVICSWLHLYTALFTGRAVPSALRFGYFNVGDASARAKMEKYRTLAGLSTLCVNDVPTDDPALDAEVGAWLGDWLARRFPTPARFERDQAAGAVPVPGDGRPAARADDEEGPWASATASPRT